ncbi:hypothetical protein IQ07DRAFT_518370, partial [Pyrenochaeta sp. DS3sAY3a]
KVDEVRALRDICLGNCRLLYGSERFKFYDISIAEDQDSMTFCAILTCNQEGVTKFLRKEVSNCPIRAVRGMVHRLQTDTAILFTKYDVGSQFTGQQAFTNKTTQRFELISSNGNDRYQAADDDTNGLKYHSPPRCPRAASTTPQQFRRREPLSYDDL